MNDRSYTNYREFTDFSNPPEQGFGGGNQATEVALSELSENVQHFCNNLSTLERRVRLLNTAQDNSRLREEIVTLTADTAQLVKMADSAIRKVKQNARSLQPTEKLQFERLVNTFSNSGKKFQDLQQKTANLEKEMLHKARTSSVSDTNPFGSLPESERSTLVEHDVSTRVARQAQAYSDSDTLAIETREREMRQLEHDIVDINDIFRDLGTMVNDQGEMIDNIEANVDSTHVRVQEGNKQLDKAVTHKRCSRKLTLIIVCVVSSVAVIVIAIAIALFCTQTTVCRANN